MGVAIDQSSFQNMEYYSDKAEHFGHHRIGGIFFGGFATTAAAVFFFHGVVVGIQSSVDFELGDGGEFGQGLDGLHIVTFFVVEPEVQALSFRVG